MTDKNNLNVGDVVIKSNGAAEDNIFSSSSDKGKIILNGKITNTNANSNVAAGKIRFNSDVYLEHPVTIDGGDITFAKNALGPAMGLNINGSGFTANNIVTGSLLDVAGGAVNVKVTGAVSIGNIETWAGNGAVGKAGGAVTISGNSVALEAINTSGSKGSADVAGGKAGAISITASSLIKLQGDMVAVDGASVVVAPEAVPALAPVPVQVTLSSAGIVDLTEVGFFTSLVNFTGGAGEDTLKGFNADGNWAITASNSGTLSQAGVTPPQTAKYITFTGFENLVGGSGSNSLTGLAGTNTWAVTGKDTVAVSGSALGKYISFSNIKNIKGGAGEDTFDFSAQEASNFQFAIADESALNTLIGRASGSNTWSVSEGANTLASNGVNYISSFSGIQTLTGGGSAIDIFNINKDFAGTINGGGGNDKFTISALVGAVSGGDGNDEFILNAALAGEISGDGGHDTFTLMKNLASTSTLSGGAGNDTFNIAFAAGRVLGGDGKDVFNIDAVAVSIAGEADDDSFNVNVPFANLISGGDGADTFNINAPVGKVFGGNGNDSFILGAGSSVADIYGNIEGALEVDENNSLTGRDAINVWKITGKHTGTVETIGFHDIQTLIGNDKKDTFGFSAGGTMLMVKGGSDSNNLMKGPDGLLVTWDITDKDAGSVTAGAGGGSSSGVTGFQNIQNLEGGTGNDTFNFMEVMDGNTVKSRGAITGLVNGGGGVGRNFLNGYKNANNSWSISSAGNNDSVKRTGVDTSYATFSSIQELGGGSGTDYFVLAAKGRALIIYGGDNAEDKLEVTGSGPVKTFWDINEDSKGSTVNGITFFGIRKLQGDEANDEFVFHNDAKVNTLSVDGGGGENILNWKAVTTVVNELEFGSEKNKFSSIGKVVGNAALSFYAGAGDNDWTFTSNILGEVKTGGKSVEFEGFGKLRGGDGKDTFIFTDATIKINADAGDGTDIVDLRALTVDPKLEIDKTVMGISGINEVWGNTSKPFGLKVFGSDPTTWTISAKNTVTVENTNIQNIKFVDFDKLVGGTGLNTFKFVNQGEITSATSGGPNKLDLSEYSVDKPITLNGSAIMGVDKIGSVAGNAAKDFTLQAIDGENTWIVDGTNSGSFKNGGSTITFTDFKNLIGGVGKDSFEVKGSIQSIGSLVNTVIDADGNLVVDSLADTSLTGKTWEIFTKDNKVVGRVVGLVDEFSNIKVLQAGNGDDTFKVNATFAGAINGGDGNNEFEINAATGTLTGGSGKDTFILNDNGSAVLINGGDNLAGNTIEISNGEAKNTWNITAANAGDILNGENHKYASFVGIQNLQGGSTADIFNINANFSGAIHGNAGNDTFNVNAIVDELFGEAGDDEFVFSGDATSEQSTANAGVVKKNIDGGDGKDTIWGRNANTRWQLMADGNNRISTFVQFTDEVTAANTYVFDFDGIESFKGGSEKDIFQNRSQEVGLEFIGGAGAGVFMINNTSSTYVGSDIDDDEYVIDIDGSDGTKADTINGKGGTNTLFARDTHNTWKVTSDNKGTLTYTSETTGKTFVNSFENIQNLVGGGQQDEFTLSAAIGKVSGGAGDDTFTFTAKGSAKQIDGYGGAIEQMLPQTDIIVGRNAINIWTLSSINEGSVKVEGQDTSYASFSHIREIRGNDDTLIGANAKSTWSIKGAGTGTLSLTDNASQLLNFSGITNLTGNQAADKFTFLAGGKINGVIDGGSLAADAPAGLVVVDTLNVEELAQGVAINLSGLKETDRLAIKNIESITASSQSANKNFLYGSSEFESYSWIIDGENKGSVALTEPVSDKYKISFENFGNIQGGTQTDLFQLLDDGQIISIVGGDGAENIIDRMDYSLSKKNVEIVLGSNNSDSDDDEPAKTKINGVEGIKGNNDGSSPANTLVSSISAVGGHVWTLGSFDTTSDGINDGEVIVDGKKVSFENFNLILGGEGDDRFKFKADGQFIGTIKGLEGDDFFDASLSTKAQVVAINGKATGQTNLYTVETIVGNSMAESRLVGAAQENIWTLAATGVSKVGSSAEVISFSGFTRLVGGALADVFNLGNASEFSLLLDGGSATASTGFKDVVNIAGGNVGVGLTSTPGLRIINMDEVNATQASSASKLIADDAENTGNSWSVTGQNKGSLNTRLNFNGFANLTGGKAVDVFTFEGIAAAIDGVIDAGAGDDILNLDAIARDVSVHVVNTDNSALASHINIINLEDVTASAGHVNKFSASDLANTWVIDAKDTGTLNRSADSAGTKFTNFSYLLGGKGEDTFNFVAAGLISDNVDGGLGEGTKNKVNVSAATFADVALSQYKNIDEFTGNNTTSSLRGDVIDNGQAIDNKWTMGVEKNTGSVNQVAFVGFANLIGGDGKDTFEVLQGGLTGSIHGGLGDDRFSVAAGVVDGGMNGGLGDDTFDISIAAGSAQKNSFIGGDGTDTLAVRGGGADYNATHTSLAQWDGELTYKTLANEFTVLYSNMDVVNDEVIAATLTVKDTAIAEEFAFNGNGYSLRAPDSTDYVSTTINYANKTNLVVSASENDRVTFAGELNGVQSLSVQNALLASINAGLIRVNELKLNNIGNVGSAGDRLSLSVNNISVANATGDIYLKNDKGLVINEFSNNHLFDAALAGDLSNTQAMTSAGNFVIDSTANIHLTQDNLLSGDISLTGINVDLRNTGVTHLQHVKAQDLNVTAFGSIDGRGAIEVSGKAVFASNDSIDLLNADNHFNALSITSAASATITDKGLLTLSGLNAVGNVVINAGGILINGPVTIAGLQVNAGQNLAEINADIFAQESLNINATGITLNGKLSAADINLQGGAGDVKLNGLLDTSNKQAILVSGNNLVQNAKIVSGGDIVLQATGNLTQSADMDSAADILVSADGDLTLEANANTIGNQVRYLAGRAMTLLGNITGQNKVEVTAVTTLNQSGSVKSDDGDLTVATGQHVMSADAGLAATKGSVAVKSADDIIARNISANNDIVLQAADLVQIDKALTATLGTIKVVAENNVAVLGALSANKSINIDSVKGSIIQNESISNRSENITLVAGNNIVMNTAGVSTAEAGNVNYSGKNIALNLLNAKNGTVFLTATEGAITDINDSATNNAQLNIDARALDAMAVTGIGAGNKIETRVSEILLTNIAGNIDIGNSREVTIKQLRTNGSVDFANSQGHILLGNVTPPASAETPTRPVADNATYQIDVLTLKTDNGDLRAADGKNLASPEINANRAILTAGGGTIGVPNRPLVISSGYVVANSRRTWKPIFTRPGTSFVDESKTSASIADISATSHEQLVQVETLAEVNPAVFTAVRNYVYDEVAILLPEDQRYDAAEE
ncbi:MAG TPA: hypothetical protein VN030_01455 [Cellvibrio sp.]|nr:hypothetical protein [Cellvibrio sp.]